MHPALTTALLSEDIAALTTNHALLYERGVLVLKSNLPEFRIAVRHARSGKLRSFQFLFDDWDDHPPRFAVVHPDTGDRLPGTSWPTNGQGQSFWHHNGWIAESGITLPMPFLCMRGTREYHEHQSHITDCWGKYRGTLEFSLPNIVLKVLDLFQESNV